MKLLFVMERRFDRGSIQSIANYILAGDRSGHTVALYGRDDPRYPHIRFSTEVDQFDYVIFLLESSRSWMSGLRIPQILDRVPREQRAIVDADGMYNKTIAVDGYDRNHLDEYDREEWFSHCRLLADKVFQPTLEPREPGILGLPFYGYDPGAVIKPQNVPPKRFDILHVGHNWWRWKEVSGSLLPAFEQIRSEVGPICFMGSWWDAPPVGAKELHLECAFGTNIEWFSRLEIKIAKPVHFHKVIAAMSTGRVNIMLQRPLFRHLKILTSKYFEIFTADTIPFVMLDPDHAELVYGPVGRELALHDNIAEKLLDALYRPNRYQEMVHAVRDHLKTHHSYDKRIEDLVVALRERTKA